MDDKQKERDALRRLMLFRVERGSVAFSDRLTLEALDDLEAAEAERDAQAADSKNLARLLERHIDYLSLVLQALRKETDQHEAIALEIEELMRSGRRAVTGLPPTSNTQALHAAEVIASLRFPTMLRKMWSGAEVQQWLQGQAEILAQQGREVGK